MIKNISAKIFTTMCKNFVSRMQNSPPPPIYDDFSLQNETEIFLELDTFPPHLPSYRYWKSYKEDVYDMLSFSENLTQTAENMGLELSYAFNCK